ncbi:hypothetical protein [Verminephrobacter eiseniae]|uniref:hypothetical protein n=1 Tax=Verminephrobacter eiseniae TaxID=364317 RepID=UPI0022381FFE|nr:hypothetical protein [Verminephrobacter eiseniae]
MQLGIFEHSRDVMLRNDVMQALERYDATAARMACEREYPLDMSLPALLALAGAIEAGDRNRFRGHDALRQARQALQESIQPVARRTFGDKGAAAWLGRLWQDLAQRAGAGDARPSAFVARGVHEIPLKRPKRAERGFVAFQMRAPARTMTNRHAPVQPGATFAGPPMEANRQPRLNGTPVCTNVVYSRRSALHRTIGGMRATRGSCRERCGLFFTHIAGVFPCMA